MKSPFPGMDPYLEQHWGDVHTSCITYSRDQLQEHLPKDLRARAEERVFVEAEDEESIFTPDVRVIEAGKRKVVASKVRGGPVVTQPLILHVESEPVTQRFIEIIDVGTGNRVITVIEFLSRSNKTSGKGMRLYLKKQKELKRGGVSLVEIDLLRAGKRVLSVPSERIPKSHRTTYQVCVRRGWKPDQIEIYRVPLQERLPAIRVPLREKDNDVLLDLQAIIDDSYRKGGYGDDLDYTEAPNPPLRPKDAAWADELLSSKGLR